MSQGLQVDARVIIVGSGPAGVSAAWPLVHAGVSVLMVDAATEPPPPSPSADSPEGFRNDPQRWRAAFGSDLAGLGLGGDRSPKFATPLGRSVLAGYGEALGLDTCGFFAAGALAQGGLSTIWGALAAEWPEEDFDGSTLSAEMMRPFYDAVRRRTGVPIPSAEDLTSLAARRLLAQRPGRRGGLILEPAQNAVLGAPLEDRQACIQCGLCLWGCSRGSIYASGLELPALRRHAHFEYRAGHRVLRLGREGALQTLETQAAGASLTLRAETVLLAAGTLSTAALALPRLDLADRPAPLLTNPAAVSAFLVPDLIGAELPERSVSLGQLFYRLPIASGHAAGVLYGADALPLHLIADRLPLSRPAALRLARALAPAVLMATVYLPGSFSRNRIRAGERGLAIEGEQPASTTAMLRRTLRDLGRSLFPTALPLPGATTLLEPGADAHYAGVLPMGGEAPFASGPFGELADGLYAVDGAVLPRLSSTHPTLTLMANAERIGEAVARRLGDGA